MTPQVPPDHPLWPLIEKCLMTSGGPLFDAARDALWAALAADEWQPIDSAPKDGTTLLLAFNDYSIPSVDFGWHDGSKWRNDENDWLFPTAWQALPLPPVVKSV